MNNRFITVEEFIKNHNHINYCEATINFDGLIRYALPSHQEDQIQLTGLSKDEVYDLIPIESDTVKWLCGYNNSVAVWYNFAILPDCYSKAQLRTLTMLQNAGIIDIIAWYTHTNY